MGKLVEKYSGQQGTGPEVQLFRGMVCQAFFSLSQNVSEPRKLNESRAFGFLRNDAAQIPQVALSLVWLLGSWGLLRRL